MTLKNRNIDEYLLRFTNGTIQNKVSKLASSILYKSQTGHELVAIVISDGSKLAPAILSHIKKHPKCKYFRIGSSYSQIMLATEMYIEVSGKQPHWSFALPGDVIRKLASSIEERKLKPLLIIDGAQWFTPFRLFSWIHKIHTLRGLCGIVMILNRKTVEELRNYGMNNSRYGFNNECFDKWYWFDERVPRLPIRLRKNRSISSKRAQ